MIRRGAILLASLVLALTPTAGHAQADKADRKAIKRLLADFDLVPSLAGPKEEPGKLKSLAGSAGKKQAEYTVDKKETAAAERERWRAGKERYAAEYPLRSAVFAAADLADKYPRDKLIQPITAAMLMDKTKLLERAREVGLAVFETERVLEALAEADRQRDKEPSKRWRATFDFVRARTETNLILLHEYSFMVARVRSDDLPSLGMIHDAWTVAPRGKLSITDTRVRALAKENAQRWEKVQRDHASTLWAHFAQKEQQRELGMEWVATTK